MSPPVINLALTRHDALSDATILDVRDPSSSDPPVKPVRRGFGPSMIQAWGNGVRARQPAPARSPSPALSMATESSAYTASSASTVRDYASAEEPRLVGTILVGGPEPLGSAQPRPWAQSVGARW